ncbi:hypothetical protein BWI92_21465 [Flectobacillus sp. BAB-3569]|nr:hypothetical protein BWI92_21465 [Flectobacillus sp. BAB-3569]
MPLNPQFNDNIIEFVDDDDNIIYALGFDGKLKSTSNESGKLVLKNLEEDYSENQILLLNNVLTMLTKTYTKKQFAFREDVRLESLYYNQRDKKDICYISEISSNSNITGTLYHPITSQKYLYSAGNIVQMGNSYPTNLFAHSNHVTGVDFTCSFTIDFLINANEFEIFCYGNSGKARIKLGNLVIDEFETPAGGNLFFKKYQFNGGKANRKITIQTSDNFKFGGIKISDNSSLSKPISTRKKAVFMSDSFGEPAGVKAWNSFVQVFSDITGIECWASGLGGTGYINPGQNGRTNFQTRVDTDVIPYSFDYIFLAGGLNDTGDAYSAANFRNAVENTINKIKNAKPNAEIVIIGNWFPRAFENAKWDEYQYILSDIASQNNLLFIDTKDIFEGIGYIGHEQIDAIGNGNTNIYVGNPNYEDSTHPSTEGQIFLGKTLAKKFISKKIQKIL